jgi:hypothetical protein
VQVVVVLGYLLSLFTLGRWSRRAARAAHVPTRQR